MPWSLLFRADVTPAQRRTLLAAALGWMLDAFDVMLYALVVAHIMRDLQMTKATVGLLNTLMLLASGAGGILFGFIADRIGRTRALALSILTYSICSFASGLSQTVLQLALFRTLLGLGMGGEWNTGATSGSRNLALAFARPGHGDGAKFLGNRLRARRPGRRHHAAPGQLALCFLRRSPARAGHLVDSPSRARVRTMARVALHSICLAGTTGKCGLHRPLRGLRAEGRNQKTANWGVSSARRCSAIPSRSLW